MLTQSQVVVQLVKKKIFGNLEIFIFVFPLIATYFKYFFLLGFYPQTDKYFFKNNFLALQINCFISIIFKIQVHNNCNYCYRIPTRYTKRTKLIKLVFQFIQKFVNEKKLFSYICAEKLDDTQMTNDIVMFLSLTMRIKILAKTQHNAMINYKEKKNTKYR